MTDLDALLADAIEGIRVASFEGPRAGSHTEWAARISAVLDTFLAAAVGDLRERHTTALRDRDALQMMVDCCQELVAEFVKPATRNPVASAMHGELAEIVGYPPVLDEATRETS